MGQIDETVQRLERNPAVQDVVWDPSVGCRVQLDPYNDAGQAMLRDNIEYHGSLGTLRGIRSSIAQAQRVKAAKQQELYSLNNTISQLNGNVQSTNAQANVTSSRVAPTYAATQTMQAHASGLRWQVGAVQGSNNNYRSATDAIARQIR